VLLIVYRRRSETLGGYGGGIVPKIYKGGRTMYRQVKHMTAISQVRMGYELGKAKGQNADAGKWVGVLFALLIFAYVASAVGPDIMTQFQTDGTEIQGTAAGEIFSLGGILVAAGILGGVGAMVGLKLMR
jgi:hypothetical protein